MFKLGIMGVRVTIPVVTEISTGTTPIYVSGAGTTGVNGTYSWNGPAGTWDKGNYIIKFDADDFYFLGANVWIIRFEDVDLISYYYNTGGSSTKLPVSGWLLADGASPAPTVSTSA